MSRPVTSREPFLPRWAALRGWLLRGEGLAEERREAADIVWGDAEPVADAAAVLVLGHEQVPDHAFLDGAVALAERGDEVGD